MREFGLTHNSLHSKKEKKERKKNVIEETIPSDTNENGIILPENLS